MAAAAAQLGTLALKDKEFVLAPKRMPARPLTFCKGVN